MVPESPPWSWEESCTSSTFRSLSILRTLCQLKDEALHLYYLHPFYTPRSLPIVLGTPSQNHYRDQTPRYRKEDYDRLRFGQPGGSVTRLYVRSRESSEFLTHRREKKKLHPRCPDGSLQLESLRLRYMRKERLAYRQESIQTRQYLLGLKLHCRALVARSYKIKRLMPPPDDARLAAMISCSVSH
ncbi:hypothetical protein Tco_0138775 [Tanacetum coccineum]